MKQLLLLFTLSFLLTSCFATRYVSNEQDLQKDYIGAHKEDIKFSLGDPDEIDEFEDGYAYIYNKQGRVWKSRKMQDQYIRVSFNKNDEVRSIQATTTKKTKKFSGWRTFGIPATVLGGLVIIIATATAAST